MSRGGRCYPQRSPLRNVALATGVRAATVPTADGAAAAAVTTAGLAQPAGTDHLVKEDREMSTVLTAKELARETMGSTVALQVTDPADPVMRTVRMVKAP